MADWREVLTTLADTMVLTNFLLLLLSVVFEKRFSVLSAGPLNVVDTGYAKYRGNLTFPNVVGYLGVPYAEPPLGDRRFRAPLPLNTTRITEESGGSIIDVSNYADFCVQGTTGGGDAGGAGSEDCLKVDIYAPAGSKKGNNLPVLVYIHGGGYVFGAPKNWPFFHWIRQSPNVVVVSVYYRLDSLGFLAVPEFSDPSNGDLNAGFLDQVEALRWVKRNIESFGGDPKRVTINGESAGGSSTELHLVADGGKENLFSGAIAQSVYRAPLPLPEQQVPLFQFYANQVGCGAGDVKTKLACLRKADVSAIARAQDAASSPAFNGSYRAFHPVLDGKTFSDYPTQAILAGRYAKVPLIVGATSNETVVGGSNIATALRAAFPLLTNTDLDELVAAYPASDFSSPAQAFQVATGESVLICARNILAPEFSKTGKSWTYRYNQPNPTSGSNATGHAAENWMMFLGTNTGPNGSNVFVPMTAVETAFAEELIAYWLSFVRAKNPNTFKLSRSPVWPSYTSESKARIVLQQDPRNTTTNSGSFIELEPEKETQRCELVADKVLHEQN